LAAILRKELTDYFSSVRMIVIMLLAVAGSALALYGAFNAIRGTLTDFAFLGLFSSQVLPSAPAVIATYTVYPNYMTNILLPLTGILLGINAVNKERSSLNRLMYQSVYRDNIINARFLAGFFVIVIVVATSMLLISGYGLRMIGVPPNSEELLRLFVFAFTAVMYGAFWMGLTMFFSSVIKNRTVAWIIPVVIWVVLAACVFILPRFLSSQTTALALMRISPTEWFSESSMVLLVPQWSGMNYAVNATQELTKYMKFSPLTIGQSLAIIWMYIFGVTVGAIVCFGVTFTLFIRRGFKTA
jgi:ABC-2 type transport system permease protein